MHAQPVGDLLRGARAKRVDEESEKKSEAAPRLSRAEFRPLTSRFDKPSLCSATMYLFWTRMRLDTDPLGLSLCS